MVKSMVIKHSFTPGVRLADKAFGSQSEALVKYPFKLPYNMECDMGFP